ncbi:MAG: hypothetical protein IPL61_15660 [Myxococcales bacterium]|nr:hypothetical protein [Myxococcales bacterium]
MSGDDPFRTATHGHSTALARLAARHPDAELIHQAEGNDHALGAALRDPAPTGCLVAVGYLTALGLAIGWAWGWVATTTLAGVGAAVALVHGGDQLQRWRWRRRVGAATAWLDRQAFPITGVRGYVAATIQMIDVTFTTPPTVADFGAGIRGHLPDGQVIVIDEHTYRVATPRLGPAGRPLAGARPTMAALRRFVEEVLAPLHLELGVVRVQLGGSLELAPPRRDPHAPDDATPPAPT